MEKREKCAGPRRRLKQGQSRQSLVEEVYWHSSKSRTNTLMIKGLFYLKYCLVKVQHTHYWTAGSNIRMLVKLKVCAYLLLGTNTTVFKRLREMKNILTFFRYTNKNTCLMIRMRLTGKLSKKPSSSFPVSLGVKLSLITSALCGKYRSLNRLRLRMTKDSLSSWTFPAMTYINDN